jgi:hypothetical protein
MKRLFYTALEETMSVARSESSRKKSAVVAGRVLNFGARTDREADYMCFSPLRRKTSELEGEEYSSRIISGIDRHDPPQSAVVSHVCALHLSVARLHLGKPESLLIGSRKSSPAVDGATAAQTLGQCNKQIERPITCVSALYDARQAS